jgi:hypothetical protein
VKDGAESDSRYGPSGLRETKRQIPHVGRFAIARTGATGGFEVASKTRVHVRWRELSRGERFVRLKNLWDH